MVKTKRIPKNYRGRQPTGRSLQHLLPRVLAGISEKHALRPDLILNAWADLVGPEISSMSTAVKFDQNKLFVKVQNSSLLHVLEQYEKQRLVQELRRRFPEAALKTIIFRIG